jgi:hypothetical protein
MVDFAPPVLLAKLRLCIQSHVNFHTLYFNIILHESLDLNPLSNRYNMN